MKRNLITAFIITLLVLGLHMLASRYRLYFIFGWFDTFLHLLGGVGIGYLSLGLGLLIKKSAWLLALVLGGSIGVAWEIFERIGHSYLPMYIGFGGTGDTILDIVCAILGALLIVAISKKQNS